MGNNDINQVKDIEALIIGYFFSSEAHFSCDKPRCQVYQDIYPRVQFELIVCY